MNSQLPSVPADVEQLLAAADLPDPAKERIRGLIGAAELDATSRVDVTREMIAHFEDGLAAGTRLNDLLADFGDDDAAATMIQRSKRVRREAHADGIAGSLGGWLGDIRYSVRRLRQAPGFAMTAILSLALGIGANTSVFSIVNGLLLRDIAAPRPHELVEVYEETADFPYNVFSYPDYEEFEEGTRGVFAKIAGTMFSVGVRDTPSGVETIFAEGVTGNYFPMLEITPQLGRLLGPDDDTTLGGHPVAVLSHAFWLRSFAGDPAIVGTEIVLSGTPYTIVGVTPESYSGMVRGLNPDMFVSIQMVDALEGSANSKLASRRNHSLFVRARLLPGVSIEQANAAAEAVAIQQRQDYPNSWPPSAGYLMRPTSEVVMFPMFDGPITIGAWLLLGVVGLVLLIACANLASFLLARAVDRRKEVAVRLALGAGRADLVRQFMIETMLLSLLGGAAGIGVAAWSVGLMSTLELPFPIPLTFDFSIDLTVLGFSVLISLVAGLLFGIAPALQATKPDLVNTLRDESAGAGRAGRGRLRNALVIAQVAISVVLLVGAGLLLRSLQAVYAFDPGFGTQPAAVMTFALPSSRYDTATLRQILDEFQSDTAARPEVIDAGYITNIHLSQTNTTTAGILVDGVPVPDGQASHTVDFAAADPEFFEAAGIPIVAGRGFDSRDDQNAAPAVIVSEAFVERFWPGEDAVGQIVRPGRGGPNYTIVGIAADTKVRTLGEAPRPFMYQSFEQLNVTYLSIIAKTRADPQATATALMVELRERVPEALIYTAHTMDDHLESTRFPARIAAIMFTFFAVIALALATIGLYGLVSYTQAQRTHEVGIRMSLGADSRSVVGLLVRGGMRLVWVGLAVGTVTAFAASRLMSGLLFGVGTTDLGTFATVLALLSAVALTAAWIPARRASRVDPVQALRTE
ncbi:MAG: FtsX-like permease family protein [Acidobacteria bacterium]|nr:FtsX-like permease family protein [Acidobacteriota bacterium]